VINMSVEGSSMKKGETLIDTAMTLNAMRPDVLVVRHSESGRRQAAVGEGRLLGHQRRRRQPRAPDPGAARCARGAPAQGPAAGPSVAICGDILHSRVARSNIHLLNAMGARVRVIGPRTLMPAQIDRAGRGSVPRHGQGPRGLPTS